ncbi:hypothetical protein FisN_2Hu356 [Fistulifera solaris]|jgi:hypothetical protein|uniref:Uncharacterized protein n=1 Tax=Fistulifera solaris TaxID=1519565 RepID=A0A1Z5KKH7_FISSO|nr:hypothetical protein FisN_2Hu356 [Fistulifera solaris]|eukprot:GAX26697.1 hypothetical protein FisN_2Hu356 [Fistulifera solaris]
MNSCSPSPSQQNNLAIELLFQGKVAEAKALFREAIANTKNVLGYAEYVTLVVPSSSPSPKLRGVLLPQELKEYQARQDRCAIPMFHKVFVTPEHVGPENLDLVSASIFYNLAVTNSIGKNECASYNLEHRLYSLSTEMLNASGYFHDPSCCLLLLALCNNIAQSSFCDGRVDETRAALREMLYLLESRPRDDSMEEQDVQFFYLNTLLMKHCDQMQSICSPAA